MNDLKQAEKSQASKWIISRDYGWARAKVETIPLTRNLPQKTGNKLKSISIRVELS